MASFESQNVENKYTSKVERIRQLLSSGAIVVKIDRHRARKTIAFTKWIVPMNAIFLYTTYYPKKTHWYEYWLTHVNSDWYKVRMSNRGNWSMTHYNGSQLRISDKELEELLAILEKV